jgi:cytochrome c oxidase assembly factor CtaG
MSLLTSIPLILLFLGGLLVVALAMYRTGKYRCEQKHDDVKWQYAWFTFGMIMLMVGAGTFVYTSIKSKSGVTVPNYPFDD